MGHPRDEAIEAMLGDIITKGSDVVASFLNDTDGQEGWGEEEGYVHDGSGDPLMPVQEEGYVHDGSGDQMEVQEGDRHDGSGDRTESGQVYIYYLSQC
jgi:hypothetical protein